MSTSSYPRVKRWKQKQSAIRARLYLDRNWKALGTDASKWTARHCASRKRWIIWYARRRQEQLLGFKLAPRRARHWVGPIERAKKAKKPTVNTFMVRHL